MTDYHVSSKESLRHDNQGYDDEKGMSDTTTSPKIKEAYFSFTMVFSIMFTGLTVSGGFLFKKIHDRQAPDSDWNNTFVADSVFIIFVTALISLDVSYTIMTIIIENYVFDKGFEESRIGLRDCKTIAYWVFLPSLVVSVVSFAVLLYINIYM